ALVGVDRQRLGRLGLLPHADGLVLARRGDHAAFGQRDVVDAPLGRAQTLWLLGALAERVNLAVIGAEDDEASLAAGHCRDLGVGDRVLAVLLARLQIPE